MSLRPHPYRTTRQGYEDAWIIDLPSNGKRVQKTFRGSEAEAEIYHAAVQRIGRKRPAVDPTLLELLPQWKNYYQSNRAKNTYADAIFCLKKLIPHFGPLHSDQFSFDMIEAYKQKRLIDGVMKRTINKELTYLSTILSWAHRSGKIEEKITIYKFDRVKAKKPRPLNEAQIDALVEAIEPNYKLILLLMVDAGLRRNEALSVKGEDVINGVIFVKGKGDKERIIPATSERLSKMLNLTSGPGYLSVNPRTGKPYYSIRKALIRAGEKAKIGPVTHHQLRHSFGTFLAGKLVPLQAIRDLLGHSDLKTTQIYAQLAAEGLKKSLDGVFTK